MGTEALRRFRTQFGVIVDEIEVHTTANKTLSWAGIPPPQCAGFASWWIPGSGSYFSPKALLRQPGGFEGRLPIGGYCDAPDLVVLDGDDGVSSQAQLEPTAATLPKSGGDAHEPP